MILLRRNSKLPLPRLLQVKNNSTLPLDNLRITLCSDLVLLKLRFTKTPLREEEEVAVVELEAEEEEVTDQTELLSKLPDKQLKHFKTIATLTSHHCDLAASLKSNKP